MKKFSIDIELFLDKREESKVRKVEKAVRDYFNWTAENYNIRTKSDLKTVVDMVKDVADSIAAATIKEIKSIQKAIKKN